jgi:hypothetical protein
VPLEILVRVQALSQPAAPGIPMGRRTIGPTSSRLGEGLAGRDFLVPSRSSDSCGGPCACTLTQSPAGVRCFLCHMVRLASGSCGYCVKKQCGLVGSGFRGRTGFDLHLSRVRTGVAVMRQDCNYQLDTTKLGRLKKY